MASNFSGSMGSGRKTRIERRSRIARSTSFILSSFLAIIIAGMFPPELSSFGKVLVVMGIILIVVGLALMGKIPFLGRLPGDIRIQRDGFVFYFPLTSMLIVSAILSLILTLLRR
jgi:hypothetical protein